MPSWWTMKQHDMYKALRREGMSKEKAARIMLSKLGGKKKETK